MESNPSGMKNEQLLHLQAGERRLYLQKTLFNISEKVSSLLLFPLFIISSQKNKLLTNKLKQCVILMYFDSCVISHNSKDLHNSLSPPLTAHLSVTNWILSSSFNVFPKIPNLLYHPVFSPLCLFFSKFSISLSYIRNSFQHPGHALSNDCSISCFPKYLCAPLCSPAPPILYSH